MPSGHPTSYSHEIFITAPVTVFLIMIKNTKWLRLRKETRNDVDFVRIDLENIRVQKNARL